MRACVCVRACVRVCECMRAPVHNAIYFHMHSSSLLATVPPCRLATGKYFISITI